MSSRFRTKSVNQTETVEFNGDDDKRNPANWSDRKKWGITCAVCLIVFVLSLNSTAITSASEQISREFDVSDDTFPNTYWPVVSWTMAGAVIPLFVLPLLEDYGTRLGFSITWGLFILSIIPQALAQNFATLIVIRILSGGCGSTLNALADGVIADMFPDELERSLPITLYSFMLIAGLTSGPVVGGGILRVTNSWRWISWLQLIIYIVCYPLIHFVIKETRPTKILRAHAKKIRKETGRNAYTREEQEDGGFNFKDLLENAIKRPVELLFKEWVVASFTLWSAFTFGMIYMFTQSVTQVYSTLYGWNEYQTSIVQVAILIGQSVGALACFYANHRYAKRERQGKHNPERRLYISIPTSFIGFGGGFFLYGWTSSSNIHWVWPTIGLALVGVSMMAIITSIDLYVTDAYKQHAASAISVVTAGENLFSAFLPLATKKMYESLGFHWASSLLGIIGIILSFAPVVLILKGDKIRKNSPFMDENGGDGDEDDEG